jgi:hypothetical protein
MEGGYNAGEHGGGVPLAGADDADDRVVGVRIRDEDEFTVAIDKETFGNSSEFIGALYCAIRVYEGRVRESVDLLKLDQRFYIVIHSNT